MFTKLYMFNKELLPYDAVLFVDTSVMIMHNLDSLFTEGIRLPAAVPCGQYNHRSWWSGQKLLFDNTFEHGEILPNNTTCNGGVVLVKPNNTVFKLLQTDCGKPSPWHVATKCVDSYS